MNKEEYMNKYEKIEDIARWGFLAVMGIMTFACLAMVIAISLGVEVILGIAFLAVLVMARRKGIVILFLFLMLILPMATACGGETTEVVSAVPTQTSVRYGCP